MNFKTQNISFSAILTLLTISFTSKAGWQQTWIDDFNQTSVNWSNWTAQIQANYNNEVQCYTDNESADNGNYQVSDGTLKIIARKQNISCPGLGGQQKSWTSGRLNSKDKQEFLYGRIEARIRFHNLEGGTWPAFWMLENRIAEHPKKNDNDFVNWPNPGAGEIDVWEWFSNEPNTYITNFFNTNGCGNEVRYTYPNGGQDVRNWHRYAMQWTEDKVEFFVNDIKVTEQDISSCAQYKEPMFILLNVAMGGNLGGSISASLNEATMEVDYVAHCIASNDNNSQYCDESLSEPTEPVIMDSDNDGINDNKDLCADTPINSNVDETGCVVSDIPEQPSKPEDNNQAPIAIAEGSNQKVTSGEYVSLNATASSDTDDDILQFFWQQTDGISVVLINNTSSSPTFIAPEVNEKSTLTFTVEVSDGELVDSAVVTQDIFPSATTPSQDSSVSAIEDVDKNNTSSGALLFMLSATVILFFRRRIRIF